MLVPEPGDQPAAVGGDLRDPAGPVQVAADLDHQAVLHPDVDRLPPVAHTRTQLDHARLPEHELAMTRTVVAADYPVGVAWRGLGVLLALAIVGGGVGFGVSSLTERPRPRARAPRLRSVRSGPTTPATR